MKYSGGEKEERKHQVIYLEGVYITYKNIYELNRDIQAFSIGKAIISIDFSFQVLSLLFSSKKAT